MSVDNNINQSNSPFPESKLSDNRHPTTDNRVLKLSGLDPRVGIASGKSDRHFSLDKVTDFTSIKQFFPFGLSIKISTLEFLPYLTSVLISP